MHVYPIEGVSEDSWVILDEEFDKTESLLPTPEHHHSTPIILFDDLAWDDQLDSGTEMSL